MASPDRASHWRRTRNLMLVMLALSIVFTVVVPMFVEPLNSVTFIGFPLGDIIAAQGLPIAFVALLFWFARRQTAIDEEHGVAED